MRKENKYKEGAKRIDMIRKNTGRARKLIRKVKEC